MPASHRLKILLFSSFIQPIVDFDRCCTTSEAKCSEITSGNNLSGHDVLSIIHKHSYRMPWEHIATKSQFMVGKISVVRTCHFFL